MENIDFIIKFLKYFILINFIFMSFSHIMIGYIYSGYSVFKKIYPDTEDEYKKLLTGILLIILSLFFWINLNLINIPIRCFLNNNLTNIHK